MILAWIGLAALFLAATMCAFGIIHFLENDDQFLAICLAVILVFIGGLLSSSMHQVFNTEVVDVDEWKNVTNCLEEKQEKVYDEWFKIRVNLTELADEGDDDYECRKMIKNITCIYPHNCTAYYEERFWCTTYITNSTCMRRITEEVRI